MFLCLLPFSVVFDALQHTYALSVQAGITRKIIG
jgi:hypothetical protein